MINKANIMVIDSAMANYEGISKKTGKPYKLDHTTALVLLDGVPTILKMQGQVQIPTGSYDSVVLDVKSMGFDYCNSHKIATLELNSPFVIKK